MNESNEELIMNNGVYIFIVLFRFFEIMQSKQRYFGVTTIYLRKTKVKRTFSSTGEEIDNADTGYGL